MGPDGSIYVTDTFNHRIRRISPKGIITTFAGNGSSGYNGDGIPATRASLYWPHDVDVNPDGVVYIADSNNHRIRRVGLDGIITTIAGLGNYGSTGEGGPALDARLQNPKSVALSDGGLFISSLDHKVRRVDLGSGIITQVAGTGAAGYSGDGGPALEATFNSPQRIQVDSQGNIYVADTLNHAIRRIDAGTGIVSTVAGTGVRGFSGDEGTATSAMLNQPRGIALEGDRLLFVADSNNQRVRRLDLVAGTIDTVAGSSKGYEGDGGPAAKAKLFQPRGLTVTPDGELIIADTLNSVLRLVGGAAGEVEPPPPGIELFTNRSVEQSGAGFLGRYSRNDAVVWTAEAAYHGAYSVRIRNTAATAQAAGLANEPVAVTSTTAGQTYTGSAWVRSTQPGQAVTLRVQECDSTGKCGFGLSAATVTLPNYGWHQVVTPHKARRTGDQLKFQVVADQLAPAGAVSVYADMFSMTEAAG